MTRAFGPGARVRVDPLLHGTVVLVICGWVVWPIGLYLASDTVTVASLGAFLTGAAMAGLDALRPSPKRRPSAFPVPAQPHRN